MPVASCASSSRLFCQSYDVGYSHRLTLNRNPPTMLRRDMAGWRPLPRSRALPNAVPPQRHRLHEDVLAILLGTLVVALGISFYAQAMLLTGSTMGLALLVQHGSGLGFAPVYIALNLPFVALGFLRMGWRPMLRTAAAVLLVAGFSRLTPGWVSVAALDPVYAAVTGGGLMGIGMLMLFRHRTGLGGINILALYLQERHGIRAGWFQLGVDGVIMLSAFLILPWDRVALSMLGAAVLNLVIGMNHRPGRYAAIS